MRAPPAIAAQLAEARHEASDLLGREITDQEWEGACLPAVRKLAHIIGHYGDAGGERRKPYYLGALVQEAITVTRWAQKKTASEESGPYNTDSISHHRQICQLHGG